MAKAKKRIEARKKASKRRKASAKPARKRSAKRATPKKRPQKTVAKKAPRKVPRQAVPVIEDAIIDVIDEPVPGVVRVTEYETTIKTTPSVAPVTKQKNNKSIRSIDHGWCRRASCGVQSRDSDRSARLDATYVKVPTSKLRHYRPTMSRLGSLHSDIGGKRMSCRKDLPWVLGCWRKTSSSSCSNKRPLDSSCPSTLHSAPTVPRSANRSRGFSYRRPRPVPRLPAARRALKQYIVRSFLMSGVGTREEVAV